MNRTGSSLTIALGIALAAVALFPPSAHASQAPNTKGRAARAEHAVAGEVRTVEHGAKEVVIHTANSVDETVKFTERTTVRGLKAVGHATDVSAKAGLEGATVVVTYVGEGAEKTAIAIEHVGRHPLASAKGTIVRVDKAGKWIVVETEAGAEETYHFAERVVVDGARGIEHGAEATGHAFKAGGEVIVHYSEDGGRKVAHLVHHG